MRTILGITFGLLVIVFATPSPAQAPEHLWSKGFGGFSNDVGNGIAVDAVGNVVVVGYFSQAVNFGGANLTSDSGSNDIFIAKYDANGTHIWSERFGGPGDDGATAVAVDGSGNILVTGYFNGTVDFGGGNLVSAGLEDIFIAKYDANGAHQWSRRFGSQNTDGGRGVAVDASGNLFVTGYYVYNVDFGGGPLPYAGNYEIFLAKYDAGGGYVWSKGFGGPDYDGGFGVAVDGSGNVVVTGDFNYTVNFGGSDLVGMGSSDIFVAKYSASGAHMWSRRLGGSGADQGRGVAVDGSGNVALTGLFSGKADFGGGNITSAGSTDIFLAKYSANGVYQWSRGFGGPDNDAGYGVASDGSGNVLVTGGFRSGVYFGGTNSWVNSGLMTMFIARFSAGGMHWYSEGFGGSNVGNAIAAAGSGKAVVTGSYNGSANFGGGSLAVSGGDDIFIAKYGPKLDITHLYDVGFDQGGFVGLLFQPSSHEGPGLDPLVTQYEAFRRTNSPAGPAWVSAAQIPATMADEYEMVAPTDADSTCGSGQHYSYYFIRAHTAAPGVFFDSPIDSGYSVDNLAPPVPTNFTFAAGHLSWDASTAADFDHFSVYGATTNSFASATLVDYTMDTEMNVASLPYSYYFVTATDHSCNEGNPASTGTLTGVGGTPASYVLSVSAYPNPFNPETTIRYTLPARERVMIDVFDARGAHVATLVDAVTPAGAYTVTWNGHDDRGNAVGSGVFFARLTSGAGARSYKMTLLK